jgi:hypothetical protein
VLYRMGISRIEALDGPRACTCAARPCARACRRRRQRRIEHPVIAPRAPAVQGQHAEMCERDTKTSLSRKTPTSNLHFVIIDTTEVATPQCESHVHLGGGIAQTTAAAHGEHKCISRPARGRKAEFPAFQAAFTSKLVVLSSFHHDRARQTRCLS